MGVGQPWCAGQRLRDQLDRILVSPTCVRDNAEMMQRIDVVRRAMQDPAVHGLGAVEPPRSMIFVAAPVVARNVSHPPGSGLAILCRHGRVHNLSYQGHHSTIETFKRVTRTKAPAATLLPALSRILKTTRVGQTGRGSLTVADFADLHLPWRRDRYP